MTPSGIDGAYPLEDDRMSRAPQGLRRDLGLIDAIGIGLGAIIGAGIFVVISVAADIAGPSFLLGLVIAGVAALCNALVSAELAAVHPYAGGTYEYGYRILHPAAGFAAGWMFVASKLAGAGAVALGFGHYLSQMIPALPARWAAVTAVIALTLVNLAGIRKVGRVNTIILAIAVLALVSYVAFGLPSFDTRHLQPFAPYGSRGVFEAAAILFFAYTGYARVATLGAEVRDPERTIPRAIIITIATALVLYMAVALVTVGAIGYELMLETSSPLQRAARSFAFPLSYWIVGIGAVTAMLGVLASQILAISRMMYAMARRRDLPGSLAHVSERNGVPDAGVMVAATIILFVAVIGTLQWVVSAAAFAILLYYAIANVASLRLDASQTRYPRAVAVIGLLSCLALAFALQQSTIIAGLLLLAVGFAFRWCLHRLSPPTGSDDAHSDA